MRTLISIQPIDDFKLLCRFSDSAVKIADIKPFLAGVAFRSLQNHDDFSSVENRSYYIEWPGHELDLSADTLWHIGINQETLSI